MSGALTGTIDFLGHTAYRLENEYLELIVVPALGSRAVSLRSKPAQTDLLRVPPSLAAYEQNPMLFGIPVLFPPNRIEDGAFTFGGESYQFTVNEPKHQNHLHGLVQGEAWQMTGVREHEGGVCLETVFDSSEKPHVLEQFPHPFRIVMRFILDGHSFIQEADIINDSGTAIPWGLGYHTTFRFPFGEQSSPEACLFSAPAGQLWELNDRVMPTGRLLDDPRSVLLQNGMPMADAVLDDVFLTADHVANEAVLTDRAAGISVTYSADESFRQWVLHTGAAGSGYICPEPYTCVTNAFNLPLDRKLTGLQALEPGEQRTVSCTIKVEVAAPVTD